MASASRKKRSRSDSFSEIRALLGRIRAKGLKRGERERAYLYRVCVQQALLDGRTGASRSTPDAFLKALDEITRLEAPRVARQPVGHDYLQQLLPSESLPIEQEIGWIAARIKHERATIEAFLVFANDVQKHVLGGDYDAALRLVSSCEDQLGISLWSTELKIALTQSALGTEAQKQIIRQIRLVRRVGIWPFVASLASTRAEPTVSISWFLEETRRRQGRAKKGEFSDYVSFRSLGEWPESSAGCARVLRTEQNHHIIDIYETFISYLQQEVTRKPNLKLALSISNSLEVISPINDFRIRKLEFATTGKVSREIPVSSLELPNVLLGGGEPTEIRAAQARAYKCERSPENAFAIALSVRRTALTDKDAGDARVVAIRGLAEGLRRRGHQAELEGRASEMCRKLSHMYQPLPFAKVLRSTFDAVTQPATRTAARDLQLAALNSDSWGCLDLVGFAQHRAYSDLRDRFAFGSFIAFSDMLAQADPSGSVGTLRPDVAAYAKAAALTLRARPDAAAAAIVEALESNDRVLATQAATIALNAYARTGDAELASALIATQHVNYGVDPEALPVRDVYRDLDWAQMESAAHRPELSIALSLIQSTEGDDKLKTYRRFALETLLMSCGVSKPSDLRSVAVSWPKPMLLFLLDKVCTPAMLDMLPSIRSTREVLEERREICGYLATLDRDNSERHRIEVLEISRELTVLDGLRTIDGSRVHVDKESLTRRLKVELAESYQRYVALVREEGEAGDGFANILKDINLGGRDSGYLYEMPVSEPDELLVSIILRCREQFLLNVPHGLDSYISKRIRHGSIVGVVRAPAERLGVVAKRNLDGTYRAGGTWADRVTDPGQRAALATAIASTSKAIDQHLIRLKDSLLHVKSPEKPYGLLEAQLNTPGYLLIRSVAREDTSLDSFIETMFSALWGMLGPSLLHVQDVLTKESIPLVSSQIQGLRAKAQKILSSADDRAEFDAAAGNASVGMQGALAAAASWFEPVESASRKYSLEELVEISLASVRATTTDFSPKVKVEGNSTYSFSEMVLPLLCDVLYIAFGNVASHGSVGSEIWVSVDKDPELPLLLFKIENDLGDVSPESVKSLEEKLGRINADIHASQGASRARSEGGSGLYKLANMVMQADGGTLSFGVTDGRFYLDASLPFSSGEL